MKFLFDFFPVLLFFITFKLYDKPKQGILAATAVIIAATVVQGALSGTMRHRVAKVHLITRAQVVVCGGITLTLEDGM